MPLLCAVKGACLYLTLVEVGTELRPREGELGSADIPEYDRLALVVMIELEPLGVLPDDQLAPLASPNRFVSG